MQRHWTLSTLASLPLTMLSPTALYAHHNQFQGFDPDKEQVVTGTIEKFAWQNPHAYIYLSSGEGNAARSWRIETLSIAFMRRMGWDRTRFVQATTSRSRSIPLARRAERPAG
jgi:hypothetical protein